MDNLFVVNTYFQLLTVINLCINVFENDINDIILTDRSVGFEEICKPLIDTGIFRNVFFVETKQYIEKGGVLSKLTKILGIDNNLFYNPNLGRYDYLFYNNYDYFTYLIFDKLVRHNKNLKCNIFEEGIGSYLQFPRSNKSKIMLMRKVLLKNNISKYENEFYLYHPELLTYACNITKVKMPLLDRYNENFKSKINCLFENSITIHEKYIFFEESFYCDGKEMDDLELILEIANIVGKDNIVVKMHPRNKINRYEKYGVHTLGSIGIPWEVFQMYNDFSNKVFLTITSSSVLGSKLYFNDDINTYLLFNCTKNLSNIANENYINYLNNYKNIFSASHLNIPKTKEEFFKMLKSI